MKKVQGKFIRRSRFSKIRNKRINKIKNIYKVSKPAAKIFDKR